MTVATSGNFVQTVIDWLKQHPFINLLLALTYFVFIVFMHGPMVNLSNIIQGALSFTVYNQVVQVVYFICLILVVWVLVQQLKKYSDNRILKLFYLLATASLIFIHSRFMFDSNVEAIHSLEFTFLAILLFPFFNRFGAAIMFTVPFMLLDELYQYWVLYPDFNDYFDLNDISMDIYGCALAMLVLFICGVRAEHPVKPLWKRIEFYGIIALTSSILIAIATCFIAPYEFQKCSNTFLVLNERMVPEPFWREHPISHVIYHVQNPLEALVCFTTLVFFYFGLDSFRKNDKLPQQNIPQP